jgi:hypothetical protein
MRMRLVTCALLALAIVAATPGFAAQKAELIVPASVQPDDHARARLDSLLYDFAVFELDTADLNERVRSTGQLSLHLNNQRFDLVLEPNDLRAPGYREVVMVDGVAVEQEPGPVTTFKGHVAGDPSSIVRLSIAPDMFDGYVKTDADWVFIDPLTSYSDEARIGQVVVYREAAVRPEAGGECGAEHLTRTARRIMDLDLFAVNRLDEQIENSHVRRNIQLANEGDGQLFQRYGNPGVFNFMSGVVNNVDGIYGGQLNLDVTVVFQQAWSNPSTDPYTSLDATTTLNQFRNWWESNMGGTARDAAHHFSGKDFNGGTIGIAWVGVICNRPDLSYGVSQDMRNSTLNQRLTAHEIGHNLSAGHDSSSCANCNGTGPIMCASIQSSGSNTFSSCSKSSISNHVHNNGFCL